MKLSIVVQLEIVDKKEKKRKELGQLSNSAIEVNASRLKGGGWQ